MDTATILRTFDHRGFPLPHGPWIMTQIWHELLFAHWPVPLRDLRPLIPPQLDIDVFEGEAWVGIVPFRMSHVQPRGLPNVNKLSSFPELNVRTYVSSGGIPGVYFFSLDAGNPIAVALARSLFHLPYFNAHMSCQLEGDHVHYTSQRFHRNASPAAFNAIYRPTGPVFTSRSGTIDHWLTERYCLYTTNQRFLYRGDIHHTRWPLQPAELEIVRDTMALSHNIHLPHRKPLLHYAQRLEVMIWPLTRVSAKFA